MTEDMRAEHDEAPIQESTPGPDESAVAPTATPATDASDTAEVTEPSVPSAAADEPAADEPNENVAADATPAVPADADVSDAPSAADTTAAPEAAPESPTPTAEEEPAPTPTPTPSGESDSSVTPSSTPAPKPARPAGQRPSGPRPSGGRPGGVPGSRPARPGAAPTVTVEPTVEPTDPHKWGRIDENGVVYVYGPTGERAVGNWQAGDAEAGLAHFARRFDDFATEIALLETRLATGTGDPKATKTHAIELRESVDTLAGIGDLDSAAARLEIVIGAADAAIAGASTARAAARAAAVAAKETLCVEAETLAESEQWKATGDRLKEIVDEWRTIKGIDRKTDDALWKRFAKARDAFTRRRGTHFADLDKQRSAAREAKEALIAKAEALSDSTEWGKTAGEYRTLMEEWKASGRAPRDVEDALWDRFRAAQEKFFSHRNQTFSERDHEFETNAAIKDGLLAEAEKINPANGLDAAKAALRSIQERWEAAGKVPRERIKEFDSRLRAVEDRIRSAEDSHWRRTDPETTARVEQFRSRVESFRAQAAKARAAGNERKAKEAEAQAVQWEEWLSAAQSAVDG
ncbi:protein of unknown function [Nakamurella panacisegetis]|uniref:DUF349 domain-containing protein n=1 Tax=Nakamurella panacisegetis TaxID=1090615 RepID=A0A1H0Q6S5_9ACTN|nr:DUF349 domain-containing protein [Nakamurella panacisegetis]SDP12398.1 protein of unknown function [Nakamurella panacisegetis]